MLALVPGADPRQHGNGEQRSQRKPGETRLSARNDNPCGQQRTHGAARIAADLENGLRQPMTAARGEARDARGLGMKNRRSRTDHRSGDQHQGVIRRKRQSHHANERESHADAQRVGLRVFVGVDADERLQNRGADLIGQRDEADLHETQAEFALQQRIDCNDQRLHHVVQKVREADRAQNIEARRHCLALQRRRGSQCADSPRIACETLVHKCVPY